MWPYSMIYICVAKRQQDNIDLHLTFVLACWDVLVEYFPSYFFSHKKSRCFIHFKEITSFRNAKNAHHHVWQCDEENTGRTWYGELTCCLLEDMVVHYSDVIMSAMASRITGVSLVCSTVCSDADQRKPQSSTPLAFVRGMPQWPVDSPHKGPVMRKMFPIDDVIVNFASIISERMLSTKFMSNTWWMSQISFHDKSTLGQVMAWRHQPVIEHNCQVTLDISIQEPYFQWGSRKYPG